MFQGVINQKIKTMSIIETWYMRTTLHVILGVFSIAVVLMLSIVGFSNLQIHSQNFQTNTFFQSSRRAASEYTWNSWEAVDYKTPFYQCVQSSAVYKLQCGQSDLNEFRLCVDAGFPLVKDCVDKAAAADIPVAPFETYSDSFIACLRSSHLESGYEPGLKSVALGTGDVSAFQLDMIRGCMPTETRPILTVLQDKNSVHYLGSFNPVFFLFTAVFFIMVFIIYSYFLYLYEEDTVTKNMYKYGLPLVCLFLSAVYFAILMAMAFRDSGDWYDNKVPMSVQTFTICLSFWVALVYYFLMDWWEKVYATQNYTVKMGQNVGLLRMRTPIHVKPEDPKFRNNDRVHSLMIFPWAESMVFFDALITVGLLGLTMDNTTLEITQVFQLTLFASIMGVSYAYDYYENRDQKTSDICWTMSFCTNVAIFILNVLAASIVFNRLSFGGSTAVSNALIAYMAIRCFMYVFKIGWQLLYDDKVYIGWSELLWVLKLLVQLALITSMFWSFISFVKDGQVLRDNVNLWLINY